MARSVVLVSVLVAPLASGQYGYSSEDELDTKFVSALGLESPAFGTGVRS